MLDQADRTCFCWCRYYSSQSYIRPFLALHLLCSGLACWCMCVWGMETLTMVLLNAMCLYLTVVMIWHAMASQLRFWWQYVSVITLDGDSSKSGWWTFISSVLSFCNAVTGSHEWCMPPPRVCIACGAMRTAGDAYDITGEWWGCGIMKGFWYTQGRHASLMHLDRLQLPWGCVWMGHKFYCWLGAQKTSYPRKGVWCLLTFVFTLRLCGLLQPSIASNSMDCVSRLQMFSCIDASLCSHTSTRRGPCNVTALYSVTCLCTMVAMGLWVINNLTGHGCRTWHTWDILS